MGGVKAVVSPNRAGARNPCRGPCNRWVTVGFKRAVMPAIVSKNREIMIVSFCVFRLILVKMKHCFNYTLFFTFCQIKNILKQDLQDYQDIQDEGVIAGDRPPHYGGPGGSPP